MTSPHTVAHSHHQMPDRINCCPQLGDMRSLDGGGVGGIFRVANNVRIIGKVEPGSKDNIGVAGGAVIRPVRRANPVEIGAAYAGAAIGDSGGRGGGDQAERLTGALAFYSIVGCS